MRTRLALLSATCILILAGTPAAALAGGHASTIFNAELLDASYTVSFTFTEQGRPSERVSEVIRCTRANFESRTASYRSLSDRQGNFQRTLASGHVVSYDLADFCSSLETNYVFQFSVRRGSEVAYVYPQDMRNHGVEVTLFKVEPTANAL